MTSGCSKQRIYVFRALFIAGVWFIAGLWPLPGSTSQNLNLSGAAAADPAVKHAEQLAAMISAGRYAQAIDLYSTLYDELSEAESRPYRDEIFAFAETRYAAEDYQTVSTLMEHYVGIFYRDLRALHLLADSEHGLKRYADEIDTLFAALEASYLEEDISQLKAKLNEAVGAYASVLIKNNQLETVVELYQTLLVKEPQSIAMRVGLARALISTGRIDDAVGVLSAIPDDSEYGTEIDQLLRIATYVNLN